MKKLIWSSFLRWIPSTGNRTKAKLIVNSRTRLPSSREGAAHLLISLMSRSSSRISMLFKNLPVQLLQLLSFLQLHKANVCENKGTSFSQNRSFLTFLLVPMVVSPSIQTLQVGAEQILRLWNSISFTSPQLIYYSLSLVIGLLASFLITRLRPVYLVDYALFKPPRSLRSSTAKFIEHTNLLLAHEPKSAQFQIKILERSGLGEETCGPPAMHFIPLAISMKGAMEEAELVIFSCMDSLLQKTGLEPKDVDILVINCTCFCPSPSLTAMVINKYRMRSNIKSFNLSGMGCSAGLISISLAKDLLQVHPNMNAVVIVVEILSINGYLGKERAMLLPNCLFRIGGSAILLSNCRADRHRAKYTLAHVVRTHKGADDKAFNCIVQQEDPEGYMGTKLSIDLMTVASEALKSNITTIAPLVLPATEQIRFALSLIRRKVFSSKLKPYIPDFKQAFEHFCIHAGGRAVIDELQKSLNLTDENVEASKMSLHRFGNTSSSSLWYELNYIESKGKMKRGDRVWQIGFGSGFKCNSAVWKCNRTIQTPVEGPWEDCIQKYPVSIPLVISN